MIKKSSWLLVSLGLGPHMGPEWSEVWVVRGAAGSAAQFVLICPLVEPSGEISWILLQMFHCVRMLGFRVGPFDLKWKCTAEVLQCGRVFLCTRRVDQQLLPPLDFPRFPPAESTSCDQRHGNSTACCLDLSLCRHSLQPFGKTPVETCTAAASIANTCIPFTWHSTAF